MVSEKMMGAAVLLIMYAYLSIQVWDFFFRTDRISDLDLLDMLILVILAWPGAIHNKLKGRKAIDLKKRLQ